MLSIFLDKVEFIRYKFWYYLYRTAHKIGIWRIHHGIEISSKTEYFEPYWIWQKENQDHRVMRRLENDPENC